MHVNSAASYGNQTSNCLFCTAAGVVNLVQGSSVTTSSNAASASGSFENSMSSASGDGQSAKLIDFIAGALAPPREAVELVEQETPWVVARDLMRDMPAGTVYAVHISGPVMEGSGNKSHWLNAMRVNDQPDRCLRFFDFQTMRAVPRRIASSLHPGGWVGSENPSSSLSPFIGIVQQEADTPKQWQQLPDQAHHSLHRSVQAGSFTESEASVSSIIAFPPN